MTARRAIWGRQEWKLKNRLGCGPGAKGAVMAPSATVPSGGGDVGSAYMVGLTGT